MIDFREEVGGQLEFSGQGFYLETKFCFDKDPLIENVFKLVDLSPKN